MGFDVFYQKNDFENLELYNGYISDTSMKGVYAIGDGALVLL